jgi:hypothetical protein
MRYKSIGARRRAVTAFAVNAAARLNSGVGESSMSNNIGSGRAKVAARRLLNHASIASNNTVYRKVEFEPILNSLQQSIHTLPYSPCTFLDP